MQSKNYNVALITTGGTISSALTDGFLRAGKADLATIFAHFNFSAVYAPLCILSENADLKDIETIKNSILTAEKNGHSGIIVTHGTDSLSFTAAALALLLYKISIPVVIVSADYPLSDPRSNTEANLEAAVEFLKQDLAGVYVSYKNPGESTKIHFASRLNYARGFDGYVSSALNKLCGYFENGKFVLVESPKAFSGDYDIALYSEDDGRVGLIIPYNGIDYARIDRCGYDEIVHDTYHSGTVKTSGLSNINLLTSRTFVVGGLKGEKYESLLDLKPNITVLDNIAPIAAYFKRRLSLHLDDKVRSEYMFANTANEYFE